MCPEPKKANRAAVKPKPTSATADAKAGARCADASANCAKWAKAGQCTSNQGYMHKQCPLSCKQCVECVDKEKACSQWAANGECKSNA